MSMIAALKQRVIAAMKSGDVAEKELLRVALGDLELEMTRKGRDLEEKEEQQIIRKMVKSNAEIVSVATDEATIEKAKAENVILEALLPSTLSVDEILAALAGVADDIKAAGNDGQATGVAMKTLKPTGASVEGKDVAQAVKQLRSAS